jgi:hypothetical protein
MSYPYPGIRLAIIPVDYTKVIKEMNASQIKIRPCENELRCMEIPYTIISLFSKGITPPTTA